MSEHLKETEPEAHGFVLGEEVLGMTRSEMTTMNLDAGPEYGSIEVTAGTNYKNGLIRLATSLIPEDDGVRDSWMHVNLEPEAARVLAAQPLTAADNAESGNSWSGELNDVDDEYRRD